MIRYFKNSIERKKARRITAEYLYRIDSFNIPEFGQVQFANWENPLIPEETITREHINFFSRFLKEGDLAIDIGAHIGHKSRIMSIPAGPSGLTLAFEPNPFVYKGLRKNASLNPGSYNIIPLPYAISPEEAEFYFISSEASFGNGLISEHKESEYGRFVHPDKVRGVNLNDFLHAEYPGKLNRLALIKIDTEGFDTEIIKSISLLLEKYSPVIITECFKDNSRELRYEQFEVLNKLGYSLFYFSDFVSTAEIEPILKKEDMLIRKHFDLYAVKHLPKD